MIEIENLTKNFGPIAAVGGINLSVAKGEVLGFLGPNGAGKSTTMKIIAGYLTPTTGRVRIIGLDVEATPQGAQSARWKAVTTARVSASSVRDCGTP